MLSHVALENSVLRLRSALTLLPQRDDSEEFFVVDNPELGISVSGETRADLIREVENSVRRRWRRIALVADESLTPAAQKLKHRLLAFIKEVKNA